MVSVIGDLQKTAHLVLSTLNKILGWQGKAGKARRGMARLGGARLGEARRGLARQGWQGKAGQ